MKRAFPRGSAPKPTALHRLESAALSLFLGIARIVPRRWALWWARRWGDFAFDVIRMRRAVGLENLRRALPDKTRAELRAILRQAYRGFAMTMVETGLVSSTPLEDLVEACDVEGLDLLDQTLRSGRGGILLAAHFGNWEIMGGSLALRGYPVSFIVKSQRNPLVDVRLNANRARMQVRVIPVGQAVRQVFERLRANEFVCILADQDAGSDGLFIDFFGRPASVAPGPALFARRTGSPILVGFCMRQPGGRFRVVVDCAFQPDPSLSEEEDLLRLTIAYTRRLEAVIRRHPEHWFWMHRRWKTQAPGAGPSTRETVPCAG